MFASTPTLTSYQLGPKRNLRKEFLDQISHLKTVVLTLRDKDGILYMPDALHKKATDLPISYSKILGSTGFH